MDIADSLRRYLILKKNLIPSTQNRIKELGREIFQAEATLNAISDEKVFLEDFKWDIRTRGFTIFNLIHLPSLISFIIFLIVVLLALAGVTIIGVIIETIIRTFILFQDFEFEDTFFYIPIKAVEDFIYYPPSIPVPIVVGLLIVWVLYSIRQVRKNKIYYENVVIPENRKKNALVPGKRRKQQLVVDNLKNTLKSTETQLLNHQNELMNIMNTISIPNQYWTNDEVINFLIQKLEYGQAKTIGKALNLWDIEVSTRRVEQASEAVIKETRESEARLARQRVEQHAQEQRNARDNIEAQNKVAEEIKRFNDDIARKNRWL
ncbi:hypothetical protein M0P28_10825 [Streptococcus pasteurianus]|uniref:hypothetical protein n=1 Tax=Streptococcus TaxID=1301 RepID=UPI000E3F2C3A|nr:MULTISPECIES: hypothetical protein [Streptococcus]MCO7182384.1 hypothetical protein [Streptococcus gallolyticus]MDV5117301.1 hypothetical protein [Streptococcus pasteurianus]MDV5155147.1 hypothetical protein [Streptococcus pasteurianus]MDV5164003.1 hypothetical protein [Streptococcus pasteurianus]RGC03030.1 hypothetical protein DWV89_03835 [Streptococcus pasteurianus]